MFYYRNKVRIFVEQKETKKRNYEKGRNNFRKSNSNRS